MELRFARFTIVHAKLGEIDVDFEGDKIMVHPGIVVGGQRPFMIDNKPRKWGGRPYKPCVSHALDCIRLATHKPPASEQARQRQKKVRPKLGIHRS